MDIFITTLILGIVSGSVYALAAVGIVLTYKTSGILNFGYGALAVFTTYIHWQFITQWGFPLWTSALVVLVVIAPLLGVFLDTQLFRRIEGQPPIIGVIATVGLFVLLRGIVDLVWKSETKSVPSLFPGGSIGIPGGANISYDQLGVLVVAAVAAGGLGAMLRYTTIGIAFRAVVNNRPVAGLMAINTGFMSGLAWALGTAFAALVGILLTPRTLLDPNNLPPVIIAFVLGAAVVGYLRSLPLAYLGGMIIGVIQAVFIQYGGTIADALPDIDVLRRLVGKIPDAAPFLLITIAVLVAPRALRVGGLGASFVVQTREVTERASPRARLVGAATVFGFLALVPVIFGGTLGSLIISFTAAIVFVSLVILTGYSGQISLGHTAFMGIAVFTAAHLVADLGLSIWLAFPLGVAAGAGAGALIGLVSVRLHGLFLALMTLAFAFMAQSLFFDDRGISGGEGGIPVPRPTGFTSETGLYYLALIALAASALLAVNLRTGRTGRILAGMRDSETACRSLGIQVTRYKVLIFSLSAAMASGGAMLDAMILQKADVRTFLPFDSLIFMTIAVVGGIFHVGGAIIAGLLTGLVPDLFPWINRFQLILFGLGSTLALAQNPEGLFGELRRGANGILRVMSKRRATPEPAPVAGGQR